MSKAVLALDLATVTGWAVLRPDGKVESGTETFAHKATEPGRRFARFSDWLRCAFDRYPNIRRIAVEKAFSAPNDHGGTAEVRGGFLAVLYMAADARGITVEQFHSGTVKKAFTGSGRATKQEMMVRAAQLGFNPQDHNEADAIAVLMCATGKPLVVVEPPSKVEKINKPREDFDALPF
jgi:Holliday junction resolvasome RuvABC endonuclease subunit